MNSRTLLRRSLRYYFRAHLGIVIGCAVATAVLTGALIVGDSVRATLRRAALLRVGHAELALYSNDRFFRSALADDLGTSLGATVAPALHLFGSAINQDRTARANRIQVNGVEERFWKLAPAGPALSTATTNGVYLNEPLAQKLRVTAGSSILLRLPKPTQLSRDAPITPDEDLTVALDLPVLGIVKENEFGRFGLRAEQIAPDNAYLSLDLLQAKLNLPGKANLLLVGNCPVPKGSAAAAAPCADPQQVNRLVRQLWRLADGSLSLRTLTNQQVLELRTDRIFLERPLSNAALARPKAAPVLTYFVNELRSGSKATPYSMVTAMKGPVVPQEMRDDEILINQWLAEDLQAKPGDQVSLAYFVVGTSRKLEERTNQFKVRAVLPLNGHALDPDLMPPFPGLAGAENCRDWKTGFPINLEKIRPKDEKYWDDYRGTPKAFVTLSAGQQMWTNRFGDLTAVRYPLTDVDPPEVGRAILSSVDPASLGLAFRPFRSEALKATEQSMDFGGLFLGFSFFLIVAALLLIALLAQFGVEQRATEVGTLLALGVPARKVRWLLLSEGVALAACGALAGLAGGVGYAKAMLWGLTHIWQSAVSTRALAYSATARTFAIAAVAGVIMTTLTIALALRSQFKKPARELLSGLHSDVALSLQPKRRALGVWTAAISAVLALGLLGFSFTKAEKSPELFFLSAALALFSSLSVWALWLKPALDTKQIAEIRLASLGLRNCRRRRRRSLATIGMFACGTFLIASIGVFRLEAPPGADKSSGTGGFALMGESTLPVTQDLNTAVGRDSFALDQTLPAFRAVPVRVREGDDASCLNLNRAQQPRLLGIRPDLFQGRFRFVQTAKGLPKEKGWALLNERFSDGSVPAIGDKASIAWALGKKVGDLLPSQDAQGRPFQIRLVAAVDNSVLQGNLLISEEQFIRHFPSEAGYRMFFIEAASKDRSAIAKEMIRALETAGLELVPAEARLAAFNAVQNTYLATFQVLGGLGLLLGSAGLGVLVLRNVLERRGELALLRAVGFQPRQVRFLVLAEHGALLFAGLLTGVVTALIAVLPSLVSSNAPVPYRSLTLTIGAILLSGFLWTAAATVLALRGELISALRTE